MSVNTTASIDGDNRVITITLTALQAKADNLANDAARFYYEIRWKNDDQFKTEGGITPYDSLTNAQKLSILGLETQYNLLLGAKTYYKKNAIDAAIATAETEMEARY